jgi:hypothetical protein
MRRVILFLLILTTQSLYVFAGTKTWNNASGGNWSNESNWLEGTAPVAGDDIIITLDGDYTVTYDVTSLSVASITLGGTTGTQTLSHGSGRTITITGSLTINSNGVFHMTGGSNTASIVINNGTIRFTGTSYSVTSPITNNDSLLIGGTSITLSGNFTNQGNAYITTGSLILSGGSSSSSGNISVSSGATLNFNSGTHTLDASSSISGAGNVTFNTTVNMAGAYNINGTTTVSGGTSTFNGVSGTLSSIGSNLTMSGGSMNALTGDSIITGTLLMNSGSSVLLIKAPIRFTSAFNYNQGTIRGTDSTVKVLIGSGQLMALNTVNVSKWQKITIQNYGTINWTGTNSLSLDSGVVINNFGIFDAQFTNALTLNYGSGSMARLNNYGTLRRSVGTSNAFFDLEVYGYSGSTVDVQTKTFYFNRTGSFTDADMIVASGSAVVFNGTTNVWDANSSISGAGNITVTAGTVSVDGGYSPTGTTLVSAGSLTFNGASGLTGILDSLSITNGTITWNIADTLRINRFQMSAGTMTGSSHIRINTVWNWSGGTLSGTDSTLSTVISPDAQVNLTTASLKTHSRRTLINYGTLTHTGSAFTHSNGATIINHPTGIIDLAGNNSGFTYGTGFRPKIINSGLLKKSAGTASTISIGLENTNGRVEVQTTSLTLSDTSKWTNSVDTVFAGATLLFSGGTATKHTFDPGSRLAGYGNVTFSNGTASLSGTYDILGVSTFTGDTVRLNGADGTLQSIGDSVSVTGGTVMITTPDNIQLRTMRQSAGTFNISTGDSIIVTTLNLTSGTLTGNSPMRIVNQFNWSGGTMSATDSTIATVIQSQALFSVNNRALRKRTLINQGTITWSTGHWENYDGAIVQNNAGALIDAQSDYWFYHNGGTISTFVNNGTLKKSAGTGTSTIQILASHSNGQIQVQSGIVTFNQTGTYANTDFTITNHAILQFNGGTQQLDANSDITGTGAVRVYNGKYTIGGEYNISDSSLFGGNDTTFFTGSTNFLQNVGSKLRVDNGIVNFMNGDSIIVPTYWHLGGTLTGNSPMRITSECRWESGTIMATDSLVTMEIPAYASLNMNGGLIYLAKRTFNIYANMLWNSGWFRCYSGAIINNYGTWDHRVNNNIEWVGGSLPYLNNYATYIKSTNATNNFIDIGFNTTNSVVQVKKGTLNINNMSNSVRTQFIIDSAATLQWDGFGRTHTIDSLSSITGAGNLAFYGGTTNMKDTVNISGETFVWGGTANFMGPQGTLKSLGKKLTLGNATAYFYGDSLIIDSLVTSGTLGGTSPIYINSKFVLNGGTVVSTDSTATITIPVGATFYWSGNGTFQRRTVNNFGTAIWTSPWGLDNNAVYNNMSGALTDWPVDGNTNWFAGTSNNFNNYGTLRKSGGTGTSNFEYYVNNYGLIEVQSGTISFGNSGTHSGGSFVLSPGSTIDFATGTHTLDATSSITGTGNVLISPATFNMDGVFNITGNTTIGGGTINFDSTFSTSIRTTINGGTTNFRMMPGHFLGAGNRLNVAGGTVNFLTTDSLKVDTLLVNATLNGNNHWYVGKYMQLTAGTMTSPNRTLSITLPVGATFNWSGNGTVNQRTVFNYGTANWSSPWGFSDSTIYNNMSGAVTNLTTDYNSNWFFATGEPYLINYGTLNKSGGTGISSFEYQISNYGTIQVDSGLTILCYDSLVNFNTGIITGKGTLDVSTRFTNAGTISPGTSPGVLSIIGNFNNSSNAIYDAEIGGTQRFSYDSLSVSGTANLNGTLTLSTLNGFIPSPNDTFKILKYGSRTGTFSTITGDSIGGGIRLYPEYRAKELVMYATNANPVGIPDYISLDEDDSIDIDPLSNDIDYDGDTLSIQLVTVAPQHGLFTIIATSVLRYVPAANFNGTDSLQYKVIDKNGGNALAWIYITVNAVNDAPYIATALSDTTLTEDFGKKFLTLMTTVFGDVDNDPTFGATNLSAGVTPYISNDSLYVLSSSYFNGSVDIALSSNDGEYTAADTFTVNISGVNNAPNLTTALSDTTFDEDFGRTYVGLLSANFSDVDGDSIVFGSNVLSGSVLSQTVNDSLFITGGANFNGTSIIRVTATDGQFTVSDTFDVNVTPVNDPVVQTGSFSDLTLAQNFDKTFVAYLTAKFTDADGVTPTFSADIIDSGVVPIISGDTLYLNSVSGFLGQAKVRVEASDDETSASDTFIVTVNPLNFPPERIATLSDTTFAEDFGRQFIAMVDGLFSDQDDTTLTITANILGGGASAQISNDSLYLTGAANFYGSFDVRVAGSDGQNSAADTFTVAVTPVNDAPVLAQSFSDLTLGEDFGTFAAGLISGNFSDVDNTINLSSTNLDAGVSAAVSNDSLYLFSSSNFSGTVRIRIAANDGQYTVADTFVVTVTANNDAPIVGAALRDTTFNEDFGRTFYTLLTNHFTDADLNSMTFTPTASTGLSASLQNDSLYLNSVLNFNGNVSVVIQASDGSSSITDTFVVYVAPQNDAPSSFVLLTPANNSVSNILRPVFQWQSARDIDGDALQYLLQISKQSNFSTIAQSYNLNDTVQTLTSDLDSSGTYFWRVTASDGNGGNYQPSAFTFQTDATKPNLRISILQGTVAKRYLDAYAYSDENLSGAVNAAFTLKNNSGTTIDSRSSAMSNVASTNLYTASYHLAGAGNLEVQVTAQDLAGNQRIATRNYTVSALLKGETFIALAPAYELSLSKPAHSESGFIVIGFFEEMESLTMPSLNAGVELIGTTELHDALKLTIRYDESAILSRPDFDERKIGIYRATESGFDYVGGQGRDHAVTASIHSFGKYVAFYDDNRTVVPDRIELAQNYPNPFNPTTTIQYGLVSSGKVKLVIYNVLGQRVRELINENRPAGYHKILWDGKNAAGQAVATGVYIYRLETPDGALSRKMLLIK